jgi:thymidylate synthase (FAD)
MNVRLIWITPAAEQVIAYCARVSNPTNQDNAQYEKLLRYCITHHHWSVFEMASACFEITTSRAISAQLIRHKSFSFQEFSQRYAAVPTTEIYEARRQDTKNRQNSIDDLPEDTKMWFEQAQRRISTDAYHLYQQALDLGIAKEQARFLLPMSSTTRLYMAGTIRSWIHYLQVRRGNGTQLEHKHIADAIFDQLQEQVPIIMQSIDGAST